MKLANLISIISGLCALSVASAQDFNEVEGVPFIDGAVVTCKASDFIVANFDGNRNYSVCRIPVEKISQPQSIKKFTVLTKYPAVVWGCFSQNELGGVPIANNEGGKISDYNRSVNYDGNCAVVVRVNYQHGGKCYPHIQGDYFEVFQSNHLSYVSGEPNKPDTVVEFVPCKMNDVSVVFEYK